MMRNIITNFENIRDGKFINEYNKLKPSKWTDRTLSIYGQIEKEDVQTAICQLESIYSTDLTFEKIVKVEVVPFEGFIYDLSIENLHNYIVEDLVTHNTVTAILAADMRLKRSGGRALVATKAPIQSQFLEQICIFLQIDPTDKTMISKDPKDKAKWTVISYEYFKSPNMGVGDLVGREQIVEELVNQGRNGEIR
jgi:hypothetical protein